MRNLFPEFNKPTTKGFKSKENRDRDNMPYPKV